MLNQSFNTLNLLLEQTIEEELNLKLQLSRIEKRKEHLYYLLSDLKQTDNSDFFSRDTKSTNSISDSLIQTVPNAITTSFKRESLGFNLQTEKIPHINLTTNEFNDYHLVDRISSILASADWTSTEYISKRLDQPTDLVLSVLKKHQEKLWFSFNDKWKLNSNSVTDYTNKRGQKFTRSEEVFTSTEPYSPSKEEVLNQSDKGEVYDPSAICQHADKRESAVLGVSPMSNFRKKSFAPSALRAKPDNDRVNPTELKTNLPNQTKYKFYKLGYLKGLVTLEKETESFIQTNGLSKYLVQLFKDNYLERKYLSCNEVVNLLYPQHNFSDRDFKKIKNKINVCLHNLCRNRTKNRKPILSKLSNDKNKTTMFYVN